MKINSIVRNFIFLTLVLLSAICCSTKQNDFSRIDDYIEQAKNNSLSTEQKDSILQIAYKELQSFPDDTAKIRRIRTISYIFLKPLQNYIFYKKLNENSLNSSLKISDSFSIAKSFDNLAVYYRDIKYLIVPCTSFLKRIKYFNN